jgi:hypothetical protein
LVRTSIERGRVRQRRRQALDVLSADERDEASGSPFEPPPVLVVTRRVRWTDEALRARQRDMMRARWAEQQYRARMAIACVARKAKRRAGTPSLEELLFLYTIPAPPSTCLIWIGPRTAEGYGVLPGRDRQRAHRVALAVALGAAIPPDHDVHHRCRTRCCVNPAHLEALPKPVHGRLTWHEFRGQDDVALAPVAAPQPELRCLCGKMPNAFAAACCEAVA